MKEKLMYIVSCLLIMLSLSGCKEDLFDRTNPSECIVFKTQLQPVEGSMPFSRASMGCIEMENSEWPVGLVSQEMAVTKASMINQLNEYNAMGGASVFAFLSSDDKNYQLWNKLTDVPFTFNGDELQSEAPIRWSIVPQGTTSINFVVAAPHGKLSNNNGSPQIRIDDIIAEQSDIVVAETMIEAANFKQSIPLTFNHIFTAIEFKAGFECTVQSVVLTNVKTSGTYSSQSEWSFSSDDLAETVSFGSAETPLNIQLKKNEYITFPESPTKQTQTIFMIPQTLSDTKLQITYTKPGNDTPITAEAYITQWNQARKITYTLYEAEGQQYIYFDLALKSITITANTYSGAVYGRKSDGTMGIVEFSGTHQSGNRYYVYQSLKSNNKSTDKNYYTNMGWPNHAAAIVPTEDAGNDIKAGVLSGFSITKPAYPDVKGPNGEPWRDFITIAPNENVSVEDVIEIWDDAKNVKGSNATGEKHIGVAKVREAGREHTTNRIHVSGNVGEVLITIDNIYSSYQETATSTGFDRYRGTGGIGFNPASSGDSKLTINIVGDNRLGCVHYSNQKKTINSLVFEGSGSLTVANTDYYRISNNGYSVAGYYRNRSCSAIGSADYNSVNTSSEDHAYNIIINSGVIFAGTTKAEFCTAIGGGGNGHTYVEINGGTITAMASATGTAIGGGSGMSSAGGEGTISINGGNVYAYNYENCIAIPSSAIGGAGSRNAKGSIGTVTISGGNVHAFSGLGTAIGGGSSFSQPGGDAKVTITGGNIIARSGSNISAGIGGGSTRTGGDDCGIAFNGGTRNGGKATIIIGSEQDINNTNNIILRTGSIGGGGTNTAGGKIGNANITIYGGDIQAQFVMAASTANTFNMYGGIVRNSNTSDKEYYCIQENGGAVYMELGTFFMSGGIIKRCVASNTAKTAKGGAVYIKGDAETSFTMTGGSIEDCIADSDGGAVYLEGGEVSITGGTISGNVAKAGNGGAISVKGGNFYMKKNDNLTGGTAVIESNAARSVSNEGGYGGGIYVAPASQSDTEDVIVDLLYGSIMENTSDKYGGGVCVNMGSNITANVIVTVGEVQHPLSKHPEITRNSTLLKGGGLYVYGETAEVNINDGQVLQNATLGYQVNQDVSLDGGGLVSLNADSITTQVSVIYKNNAEYYIGETDDTRRRYVVSSNDTKLPECPDKWTALSGGYYNVITSWNTKRDGTGKTYTEAQTENLEEDLILYAQWAHQ